MGSLSEGPVTISDASLRAERGSLVNQQALQSAIFNSAHFSSIATDAQGVIQIFNVGAERMLGYTAADVVNKITPADISDPQEVIARATALSVELSTPITPGFEALVFKASRGIEDIYELTYIRKDGSRFPAVVSVTALRDAQDAIIGYLLIGTDNTARMRTEERMRASLKEIGDFKTALDEFAIMAITNARGKITYANSKFCAISQYSRDELLGQDHRIINSGHHSKEFIGGMWTVITDGRVWKGEFLNRAKDGSVYWVDTTIVPFLDAEGKPYQYVAIRVDITDRKEAEDMLFIEKERAQMTLNSIGDAVISTGTQGDVTYLNAAAERLTGWSGADAVGRSLPLVFNVVNAMSRAAVDDPDAGGMPLREGDAVGTDSLLIRRDGSELPIQDSAALIHHRDGRVTGAVIVFRDMTATRMLSEKMEHFAHYDVLTDLPNRTLFHDRLTQAIALARRQRTGLAVLFVDLDRFKHINDSLGHAMGDALLQSVTTRLLNCVRRSDTVSRRGGDEFVVLLSTPQRADHAATVAEAIIDAIAAPHEIWEHVLHVTASVGISTYPDDHHEADGLIGAADEAMYYAKASGRNNSQFFTSEMNTRRLARRSLEGSLRDALQREEFTLHYQSKVDLETSRVTAVEALVRWRHPTRGLLAPGEFVPIAEECGLILPIGRWVLWEACRQARAWQDAGLRPLSMAVNVSAIEFRASSFLEYVSNVLHETRLEPRHLELEVTESVLMAHADATTVALSALKNLGIQLAVDDFGTGYSSLSYLSRFPVDTLKIDQSFINDMTQPWHDDAIIKAVIAMGRSLKLRVIAEGIETADQLAVLQSLSCDEGQGFYFSHPVAADQFARMLQQEAPPLEALPSRT